MSSTHLGGPLNVHGSSSSFAGGHSFSASSNFHSSGIYAGGYHGGWGGYGWRGGWGGCWGCGFGWGWGWGWGLGWGGWWGPGWGFGWGWPGYGYYNPYWGWPGYGYGDPGYGVTYSNPDDSSSNLSPDYGSGSYSNNSGGYDSGVNLNSNSNPADNSAEAIEPQGSPDDNPDTGNVAASTPTVLIYLKDGTTYAASDYWLADGQLHYIVNYGGESTLNMDDVDLQRTVDENARRGVNFSLKPRPNRMNPQPGSNGESSTAPSNQTAQPNRYNNAAPATAPAPPPNATPQPQTETTSQTI
ncbi:MAG: hypothetical protein WA197_18045 [Candidatus Acidiferrales bacterium]